MKQKIFSHNPVHHKPTILCYLSLKRKIEKYYVHAPSNTFLQKTAIKLASKLHAVQTALVNYVFLSYSLNSLKTLMLMHLLKLFTTQSNKFVQHSLNKRKTLSQQAVSDSICHPTPTLLGANLQKMLQVVTMKLRPMKLVAATIMLLVATEMLQPQSFSMK